MKYIFIVFLISLSLQAQKSFEFRDISKIVLDEDEVKFYKKNNNTYNEVELSLELTTKESNFKYEIIETNSNESLNEIQKFNKIIDTKNIIPIEKQKLLQLIKKNTFSVIDEEKRYSYFLAHPSFFIEAEYDLTKEELKKYNKKYFGDFNNIPKEQYQYYILDLGQNKYIIFLKGRKSKIIFNTQKGLKMFSKELDFRTINTNPINFNKVIEITNPNFIQLNFYEDNFIKKDSKGKYELKNIYDENLINVKFDTLTRSQYFIVGKINNEYKIYNCYFKELPIKKVKSFNIEKDGIEIIKNNKLFTYNIEGAILDHKYISNKYPISATSSYNVYYKILQNKNYHYIKVNNQSSNLEWVKEYIIKNIPLTAKISFLDGNTISNQNELNYNTVNHNFIIANIDNKYGLFEFPSPKIEKLDTIISGLQKLPSSEIELKVLLDVKYDSISAKNNKIIFSKENLYGFYGITKDVEYKYLKAETNNYYRVIDNNNKSGWLSFYEKKVFWDE